MTAPSVPSPTSHPSKRPRQTSPDKESPTALSAGAATSPGDGDFPAEGVAAGAGGKVGQSSSFRNVSACNRCRLRKNRCDQKLPCCASCEKAGVACVGYDPITKREIPRRLAPIVSCSRQTDIPEVGRRVLTELQLCFLPRDTGPAAGGAAEIK